MYLYQFGHHSCEESGYIEISHINDFSSEEFEDFVIEAIAEVLVNRRPHHRTFASQEGVFTKEWLEMCRRDGETDEEIKEQHRRSVYFQFSDIINEVRDYLIEVHDFKKVEYSGIFDIWGWSGLVDEEDTWGEKDEPLFVKIRKKYKETLKKSGK